MYSYDPAEELHEAEQELLSDVGDPKVSIRDGVSRGRSAFLTHTHSSNQSLVLPTAFPIPVWVWSREVPSPRLCSGFPRASAQLSSPSHRWCTAGRVATSTSGCPCWTSRPDPLALIFRALGSWSGQCCAACASPSHVPLPSALLPLLPLPSGLFRPLWAGPIVPLGTQGRFFFLG